jgi:hypothetical protein
MTWRDGHDQRDGHGRPDGLAGVTDERDSGGPANAMSVRPAGVETIEARWILPGLPGPAVMEWFDRFPAREELREDLYLTNPIVDGLSVKIRGDESLDVKAWRGRASALTVGAGGAGAHPAAAASAQLERWQKWSFPLSAPSGVAHAPSDWTAVRKRRRITYVSSVGAALVPAAAVNESAPHCSVELTEIGQGGGEWWTLGLEAAGALRHAEGLLQATAALVFAVPPPGVERLVEERAMSYSHWLRSEIVERSTGPLAAPGVSGRS